MQKIPFMTLFRNANPDALDLLDRMLAFDPSARIAVEDALEHRYLQIWHDASDEPACPAGFDFHFEVVDDIAEMKKMILAEVQRFRQVVRVQCDPNIAPQDGGALASGQGQPQTNVPIPNNYDTRRREDPRPQEASFNGNVGLEQDLQGLDAMRT